MVSGTINIHFVIKSKNFKLVKMTKEKKLAEKFSKAAAENSGRVHIVPNKDGWAVKKEGAKRATVVKTTREGAVRAASSMNSAERVIIHKKDGTIQSNTSKK